MNAFVLSGAGNRGAMEAGIRPDLIAGSSSGAINAAYVAGFPTLEGARRLAAIWQGITRQDVFPGNSIAALWRLSRRRDRLYEPTGLERLLRRHLPYRNLEDAKIQVVVVATELATGRERWFDRGDAVPAILASAALPGAFPPVEIEGERYIDGGVANRIPISAAVERGADAIWVVDVGFPCESQNLHRGAVDIVLQAVGIMGAQRLRLDLERYGATHDLVYLPLPCHLTLRPTDFSKTYQLIEDGYRFARQALAGAGSRPVWLERSGGAPLTGTDDPPSPPGDPGRCAAPAGAQLVLGRVARAPSPGRCTGRCMGCTAPDGASHGHGHRHSVAGRWTPAAAALTPSARVGWMWMARATSP